MTSAAPRSSACAPTTCSTGSRTCAAPTCSTSLRRRCCGGSMSSVTLLLVNERTEIQRLGEMAERFGADQRLSDEEVMSINLVLDEVVTNIIDYGFEDTARHEIRVTMGVEGR